MLPPKWKDKMGKEPMIAPDPATTSPRQPASAELLKKMYQYLHHDKVCAHRKDSRADCDCGLNDVLEAYRSASLPVQQAQSPEREILNAIHHALGESELSDDTELPKMISDLRSDVKRLASKGDNGPHQG